MNERSRIRLNLGLWLAVLVAGALVIVLAWQMWSVHADDGGSVLSRVGRTLVDKKQTVAVGEGRSMGSGVVKALPAAPVDDQDRIAEVLEDATKFVNTFMNVDYETMDSTFEAVRSMATGQFRTQFDKSLKSLRTVTTRLQSVETAQVIWAGYSSGDKDSATVLLATQGSVSSTASKGAKLARYDRVRVDLQKVGDRWLANNITFLAA